MAAEPPRTVLASMNADARAPMSMHAGVYDHARGQKFSEAPIRMAPWTASSCGSLTTNGLRRELFDSRRLPVFDWYRRHRVPPAWTRA